MKDPICENCGEEADWTYECERCGDSLCERCYGDITITLCRDCEHKTIVHVKPLGTVFIPSIEAPQG